MNRTLLLPLLISPLLLSGCVKSPPQPETITQSPVSNKFSEAKQLTKQREYQQAALLYQQLAEQPSSKQDDYHLLAAESFILAGHGDKAKQHLDKISRQNLSLDEQLKQQFLYGQYDLSVGEAELAIHQLKNLPVSHFKHQDKITYYKSLVFAYSLTGELLKSVQQRILLSELLRANEQQQNNKLIFEALNSLSLDTLRLAQIAPPDVLSGWLALMAIFKQHSPQYASFNATLSQWKVAYPNHPANSSFLKQQLAKTTVLKSQNMAYTVGVFLPKSGSYAKAAKAIQAGMMSAYEHNTENYQPNFQFYDTESAPIAQLYQQAINEGVELIIGPLNKKHLSTLVQTSQLTVPVLALNYVPELSDKQLYQFSLSPLDDSEQITAQAKANGHHTALLLTANNKRGQRMNAYFSSNWESLNGQIISEQSYPPKTNDFSATLQKLLNLNESNQRYKNLRKFIPDLHHVAKSRNDVDAIFLSATPKAARLLNPQLHFYGAANLPVYASSRIYQGLPNPDRDKDLEGIQFCDLPWVLNAPIPHYELSLANLRPVWEQFPAAYLRLIALGIDAFHLIPQLNKLDTQAYHGLTGKLYTLANNRIKRELACAKFSDGQPQLIDSAGRYD